MDRPILTAERLRELLSYDPETGIFTRRVRRSSQAAGTQAGWLGGGYWHIKLDKRCYLSHRLAWLHVYSMWPTGEIDHIDADKTNNCIANLRDVSHSVNQQNIKRPQAGNISGHLGVTWHPANKRWQAAIRANGHLKYLGSFDSPEAAYVVYVEAKRRLHPGCTI